MKRLKKSVALVTTAALLAGSAGSLGTGLTVSYAAEPNLLVDMDFENLQADQEITGDYAKASGTYTIGESYAVDGHALHLDGQSQFLSVTGLDGGSLLTGQKELTISYEAKHERTQTNWIAYAEADSSKKPAWGAERYIGILQNNGTLSAERYYNTGGRPAVASTQASNDWMHVDVVLSQTDTAIYVNGEEKSRVDSSYPIDKLLGDSSSLYIGRANWGNGEYFQGLIDNFRIYDKALNGDEVTAQYQDFALEYDTGMLTLPEQTDRSLELPATGGSGVTAIIWESGNKAVIADDGTVTRPDEDTAVTMTATIEANGRKLTKDIVVTVLKKNPEEDLAKYTDELTLDAGFVSKDLELPKEWGDAKISWKSDNPDIISDDGKVTRAEGKNQEAILTATITVDGASAPGTKKFPLTVIAKGTDVASYVSSSPATGQNGGMKLAAQNGGNYSALHKDQPVLYPLQTTDEEKRNPRSFVSPKIFRKADMSFGVVAAYGGNSGVLLVYDSADLITYANERRVTLPGIDSIAKLDCVYDSTDKVYKLFVQQNDGSSRLITTADFETFDEAREAAHEFEEAAGAPEDAQQSAVISLTEAEYEVLAKKFTNPENTKISGKPKDIEINKGEDYKLDSEVEASYSDGTKKTLSIRWNKADLAKINTSRPGTYTVRGTIGGSAYYTEADEPLIEERADPFITYNEDDGYYYFTASYPMNGGGDKDGYDRLILRRAKTISGLADAEEVSIWDENMDDGSGATGFDSYGRFIWAPELHKIGGSWYFVSTAGDDPEGGNFGIRPFMIKCNNPDDMMNPDSWGKPQRVKPVAGDEGRCMNAMSLDMTHFTAGGRDYLAWADVTQGDSSIYIATIDPSNPTQLTSKCSIITVPEYSWELVNNRVDEGPAVIQKDGKVYLAFSASGTGMEYCVGLLTGNADDDLTNPDNWEKTPYPILTSVDFDNEVSGPGHNSFSVDEYGNPVIVYHARPTKTHTTGGGVHNGDPLYDPCRHCYVKPVFFGADGAPILNLSDKEFAADSEVSVKITVKGDGSESDAPILEYDFDEEYQAGTAKDGVGSNDAALSAGASYVQDEAYGQVLYLNGAKAEGGSNSYLEFPKGFFDGHDSMTISMDVKEVTRAGNYFTFAIGQDEQKYLFLKTQPTYMKLAITKSSYQKEKVAEKGFTYPNNSRRWINVKMVITPDSISLYQDGELIAENNNTNLSITDLGSSLKAYLGKSFYSGDKYFRGYFDNVKVYDWAMTDADVKSFTEQEAAERKRAMEDVNRVADSFIIPNADKIKGNITLPAEKDGVSIAWQSSDEGIISTQGTQNEGYDAAPAGLVARQEQDAKVTLTATFSKDQKAAVTKAYDVTVKAAPEEVSEEDYAGYLFVHFTGSEGSGNDEQTYLSLSKDGLNWEDLNGNKPVLKSTFGESGLRDHFIARAPEGDKFYMIATDLSIYNNKSWMEAGSNGSHSIVVWESDDLVNWSEPWLSEIAPEGAGCTWAPEFIYDEKTGEYVVYWASTTLEVDGDKNITQEYENHTIYYCKTRDFRTYTDPRVYHSGGTDTDGKPVKVIDSTMIANNGTYYRYTKNESKGVIEIDKSDSVLGSFAPIASQTLTTDLMNAQGAVEGPIIFKLNEKTADGQDQWCLMVDRFARGQGYYPLLTTDLESGEFTMLDSSQFSMPSKYRHGYVMPVTASEYSALQRKWGDKDYVDTYLLERTIKAAQAVNPENYTAESYDALAAAIQTAQEALTSVKTTEEADAAAAELQKAIDALEPVVEITLTSIEVTPPSKTEYQTGEELDLAGMKVMAVYSDGTRKDVTGETQITGYDKDKAGTQTIQAAYEDKTATFIVTVKAKDDGNVPGKPDGQGQGTSGGQADGAGNKGASSVKTGDQARAGVAILFLILAGGTAALILVRKRKASR